MESARWIQLSGAYVVKPLRALPIALEELWPQVSREVADWVRSKQDISASVIHPQLEFAF